MAWKLEKTKNEWRPWRRWEYEAFGSSHGLVWGYAWTKWGASRKLLRAEDWLYNH